MNVNCFFECPRCSKQLETKFDIGEHFADIHSCDYCEYVFTGNDLMKIQDTLEEQSFGAALDYLSDKDYN